VRFLAVGELMLDVAVSGRGHASRIGVTPGGSAAVAAAWAAHAGAEASVIGAVGDDFAGRALRRALEERGIDARLMVDPEAPTGTFLALENGIRVDRGANAAFPPPREVGADAVLVSGYLPPAAVDAVLAVAQADWVAVGAGGLAELPAGGNAVLADEEEARRLTGAEPEEAARALGARLRLACVTLGRDGAVAVLDGESVSVPGSGVSGPHAFGAGDAFAAGLLVALPRGASLREALLQASELGAQAARCGAWPRG
jgi:ribokinase